MVNARRGRPVRRIMRVPEISAGRVAQSGANERVEDPIVGDHAGAGNVAGGVNAANAGEVAPGGVNRPRVGVDRLEELLTRILERLPGVAPPPAPEAPPRAEVQPRVAEIDERPSYLKMMEQMQRIGTWFFSGTAKPEDAEEWRSRMERNFHSIRCPAEYRVDLAVHYLEGDAHLWWKGVTARRVVEGMRWGDFVEEFNSKYFPQEALDRLQSRFLNLFQGNRTVREYEMEFNRLKVYAGCGLDDEKMHINRFRSGLRAEVRRHCLAMTFRTLAELVEKAALIEDDAKNDTKVVNSGHQSKKPQQQYGSNKGDRSTQGQKRKWEDVSKSNHGGQGCFKCGSKDHKIANCPKDVETRSCYYCKEVGHLKPQCPKLQQRNRGDAPPVKQAAVMPRVYSLGAETGEPSARPITGNSSHP